jgi:hypothetical protein
VGDYFATLPGKEIAGKLEEKVERFYQFCSETGRTSLLRKCHAIANGLTVNGSGATAFSLVRAGEQGEIIHSVENHLRNIGINLLTITTAQRPAIQCNAANSDYRSLAQTLLASGLVDYYLTERRLESKLKRATKSAIFLTEGFALVEWDAQDGEPYIQGEDGATIKAGDVRVSVLGPLDVIRDVHSPNFDELSWVIAREWENKHELAARYPEMAEEISSIEADYERESRIDFYDRRGDESDLIPVYKFFHKRTAAVPDGRMVSFLSSETVLFDGPNPYPDLPVYRVVPDDIEGTPFGTSPVLDLLGPQDAVNALDTSIITNQLGRGIGNIVCDDNADVSVEELSSSMNLIKKKPGTTLEPLEWPATPKELFDFKAEKIGAMEVLSGINSVVRGSPSDNVGQDASGAKLALIQAQAVQSNSGLQASYANLLRDVCLAIIHRFRDFGGEVPRTARLAGKNNQYLVKEFTAADLSDIDRVTVDVGNPLMRTVSGKMAIADKLMELPAPERSLYLNIIKAGTYEPLIEGEQSQQMRIRSENERLQEGNPQRAMVSDPHWLEVKQHLSVLDNPALREPSPENDAVAQAVLEHVQEHLGHFRAMPPELVMMVGGPDAFAMWQQAMQAMAPPPEMGGTPPPAPGETTGTPPPEEGAEDVTNPEASQQDMPGMPSMPKVPEAAIEYAPSEVM